MHKSILLRAFYHVGLRSCCVLSGGSPFAHAMVGTAVVGNGVPLEAWNIAMGEEIVMMVSDSGIL